MKIELQPECVTLVADSMFEDSLLYNIDKAIKDSMTKEGKQRLLPPTTYNKEIQSLDIWTL